MYWGLLNVCARAWCGDIDLLWHLREEQGWVKGSVPLELRAVLGWVCSLLLVGFAPAPPALIIWVHC